MMRAGHVVARRWHALTGSASAAAVALGLLACLCTLLAVIGPRAGAQMRTAAFRKFIAAAPATQRLVIGSVADNTLGQGQPNGLTVGAIERAKSQVRANLRRLPLAASAADWSSLTTQFLPVTDISAPARGSLPPRLELTYRDSFAQNVRVVAGRLPGGTTSGGSSVLVQSAVTQSTARWFGVTVGSRLPLLGSGIVLDVTAIVKPRHPSAAFWAVDPLVAGPEFVIADRDGNGYWTGAVFIPASAVLPLQTRIDTSAAQISWMFPLAVGTFTAAQAAQLSSTLAGALATAGHVDVNNTHGTPIPVVIGLTSRTGQLIAEFAAAAAAVASVLDLLAVSLAVLAAVVVLLAGFLLTEQRRQELALLRARGASLRQLALGVLAGSAVTVLPGAAIGAALAVVFTPTAPVALSWYLAGLEVLAALAGPAAMTVRVHRGYAASTRSDQPPGRVFAARRLVVEAALVLGSVGGVAVLHYQGSSSGTDVYPAAAPVLVAIGVAVVVVRVYPVLVRGMVALAGRGASPAVFLGLVRAARASGSAALPAFALVLALALVSFAGMVRSAVLSGEVSSSWQQTGADAVITSPRSIGPALTRAVSAVPGVKYVAAAGISTATMPSGRQFYVLSVDAAEYSALIRATPLPTPPAAFTVTSGARTAPGLATPNLAAQLPRGRFDVAIVDSHVEVQVIGRAPSMSAVTGGLSGGYVVLPRQTLAAASPAPDMLLVVGAGINQHALSAAVARHAPAARIVVRARQLAALEDSPLEHGAYLALALGGAAAVGCGLLVLLLSLLLSAPLRQLTLTRLSTMGLSAGQARLVAVLEAVPQLLAVLAGGTATAAVLGPLLGPALGLSVFTGSASSVPVRIEPVWLAAAAAAMLVLAIVTLTGQSAVTSHNAARSVRMEG
jgi:putative ABC transport system permease protein